MKIILQTLSYLALVFVIIAPCMYLFDIISIEMMKKIMFITAIVWFTGMMLVKSKLFA